MHLYVGSFGDRVTEDMLHREFGAFGQVESCIIFRDSVTGRSKGFGLVAMPDDNQANDAIKGLNGKDVFGQKLVVNKRR